ncbi:hypothetical protein LV779_17935 [Streptomyces thinghirensis]|nr:hypothetical protein [Streptomyces thinghirensis]
MGKKTADDLKKEYTVVPGLGHRDGRRRAGTGRARGRPHAGGGRTGP